MIAGPYTLADPASFAWPTFGAPPPKPADAPRQPWERRPAELCQLVGDWKPDRFPAADAGAIVEEKRDGIRALWLGGQLVTRNGAPIWATEGWWPAIAALAMRSDTPLAFDGEWTEPGGFEATRRAFEAGAKAEAVGQWTVFDALPLAEWERGASSEPLIARKRRLDALADIAPAHVAVMPWRRVWMPAAALAAAEAVWAAGGEGVVVKDASAPYVRARSSTWLKVKRRITVDCPVVDVEADPKDPALALRIVVDAGVRVRVNVSGWKPWQRQAALAERDSLIGRMVEVEAMERTERGSLREPRFKRWKDDE